MNAPLTLKDILGWLREDNPDRLATLWAWANETRHLNVGDTIHLRGLVEISSRCGRQCAYCGLRASNDSLTRYRMSPDEILVSARQAVAYGYGTVVLQAGEDFGLSCEWVAEVVRQIKLQTPLAVTLSLGERTEAELAAWRNAGADRYLLRFETSDPALFQIIHPSRDQHAGSRIPLLRHLKQLGYEVGSGIMVGLPGQTYESVARDIDLFLHGESRSWLPRLRRRRCQDRPLQPCRTRRVLAGAFPLPVGWAKDVHLLPQARIHAHLDCAAREQP